MPREAKFTHLMDRLRHTLSLPIGPAVTNARNVSLRHVRPPPIAEENLCATLHISQLRFEDLRDGLTADVREHCMESSHRLVGRSHCLAFIVSSIVVRIGDSR